MMETIQGYIDHFIYYNESNGYGVIELYTEEEDIICVGTFSGIGQGENVEITGQYVEHAVYGRQMKAESVKCQCIILLPWQNTTMFLSTILQVLLICRRNSDKTLFAMKACILAFINKEGRECDILCPLCAVS